MTRGAGYRDQGRRRSWPRARDVVARGASCRGLSRGLSWPGARDVVAGCAGCRDRLLHFFRSGDLVDWRGVASPNVHPSFGSCTTCLSLATLGLDLVDPLIRTRHPQVRSGGPSEPISAPRHRGCGVLGAICVPPDTVCVTPCSSLCTPGIRVCVPRFVVVDPLPGSRYLSLLTVRRPAVDRVGVLRRLGRRLGSCAAAFQVRVRSKGA